jgi:hypothetical protein
MADRTLIRIPISDITGYAKREIVAAVEHGQAVTFERNVSMEGDRQQSAKTFWDSERQAVSVALSNAGFGPLDPALDDDQGVQCLHCAEEVYVEPGVGLVCRQEGGTYDYCEVSRSHRHEVTPQRGTDDFGYAMTDGWVL